MNGTMNVTRTALTTVHTTTLDAVMDRTTCNLDGDQGDTGTGIHVTLKELGATRAAVRSPAAPNYCAPYAKGLVTFAMARARPRGPSGLESTRRRLRQRPR